MGKPIAGFTSPPGSSPGQPHCCSCLQPTDSVAKSGLLLSLERLLWQLLVLLNYSVKVLNTVIPVVIAFWQSRRSPRAWGRVVPMKQFGPRRTHTCARTHRQTSRNSLKRILRDVWCEGCGGWDDIISLALHLPPQCMKQGKQQRPGTLPLCPVSPAPTPSPLSPWEEPLHLACWWTSRIHLPWHQMTPLEEATVVNGVPDCPAPGPSPLPLQFLADENQKQLREASLENHSVHSRNGSFQLYQMPSGVHLRLSKGAGHRCPLLSSQAPQ